MAVHVLGKLNILNAQTIIGKLPIGKFNKAQTIRKY